MTKIQDIKFRLLSIKEIEFSCKSPVDLFDNSQVLKELNVQVKVNYRWNIEKNLFGIVIDFFYFPKEVTKDSEKNEFLKFTYITEFFIEELNKIFLVRSNNDFDIDEGLEVTLVGLSISTGRGILFEKTKGTIYNNFLFPIVNPSDLILSKQIKANKKT